MKNFGALTRRVAIGLAGITVAGTSFAGGTVDAGRGPVCNDNEAPVCEDPPPPPPPRLRITVVSPGSPGF